MRLVNQSCPKCGAELSIDMDKKQAFCQYCGAKLMIEDENSYTINQRIIDEARIKEAELRMKELEFEREKELNDAQERKAWKTSILIYIAASAVSVIFLPSLAAGAILLFGGIALIVMKPRENVRYMEELRMQYTSDKNKLTTFLLCLFFGQLGVHYFYVGRIGMGILYLFTLGLGFIGWFIDLIRILTGHFKDKYGRKLT